MPSARQVRPYTAKCRERALFQRSSEVTVSPFNEKAHMTDKSAPFGAPRPSRDQKAHTCYGDGVWRPKLGTKRHNSAQIVPMISTRHSLGQRHEQQHFAKNGAFTRLSWSWLDPTLDQNIL